jgi:class 3 adenylate cyclase
LARDHRRLAAIVSLDVAGYSRLMGVDDSGTLAALKAHRRELIDPKIAEHDAASSRRPATACCWNSRA